MTKTLTSKEVARHERENQCDGAVLDTDIERLCATIREFEVLLAELTEKLRLCEPAINSAFGIQAIHGHQYSGPTGREMEAAEAFLRRFRGEE